MTMTAGSDWVVLVAGTGVAQPLRVSAVDDLQLHHDAPAISSDEGVCRFRVDAIRQAPTMAVWH